jgi:UDP-N-acetylmuramyl pentapeptide synthase
MKQRLLNMYYRILGSLARRYLAKTKPIIIGINGSVGKTSCRMIVAQTLKTLLPNADIYTSPKNFNGELGMSLSIFRIEKYKPSVR